MILDFRFWILDSSENGPSTQEDSFALLPEGEGRGEGFHGQWFERPHHDPDPFDKLRVTLRLSMGEHKSNGSRAKHYDS